MRSSKLVNIGAKLEKLLQEVDIASAESFLAEDPYELYKKLAKIHLGLHLAVLASFVGAHTGTPWYYIYHQLKKEHSSKKHS
jgi:hypothetical protein